MDYSLPGSSVLEISQARILKWVTISFSRASFWPRDQNRISCLLHWQVGSLPLVPPGNLLRRQVSSFTQSCLTLCDPTDCSMSGFPVHHQLLSLAQTHVHQVGDAIQPSHPLSPSPLAFNLPQHQGLFQWVSSLYQVAKVLEFQKARVATTYGVVNFYGLGNFIG